MEIIGHRGAKGLAPENTLESIKSAMDNGATIIEVDLRMYKNKIVLSHDPTLKTQTYCLLADALRYIDAKVPLILEIKEEKVVEHLENLTKNYLGEITYSSKIQSILYDLKKLMPSAKVAVTERWSGIRAVAQASLLDTREIHINHNWLWGGFVRSMKHKGYTVYAYTVNNVERAEELEEWGVDGIFTDYPDRFKK